MWHMDDDMAWWMALGSAWFVAFWAVVIWAVARPTERVDSRLLRPNFYMLHAPALLATRL